MKTFCILSYYKKILKNVQLRRHFSVNTECKSEVEKIRNIGILAHIDAGKTTTTERMLFYSGTIRSMGEVHHGNTVTDYMEQERQRGITITSAAVSFPWHGSQINLIDTPGHIDFTMEVEQSLAVLDGAVIVLDASAGVEAQTLTVWRQANGYKVPRILYLNKMDRSDANVNTCVASVRDKLQATPLLLHIPITKEGRLIGLVDLVTREEILWTQGRGQKYTKRELTEKEDGPQWEMTMDNRRQLIDELSNIDDQLADLIIQLESLDNISSNEIKDAIRRCTLHMKAFPILCGSSYKNIGVQTLMDSIVSYLPCPLESNKMYECFDSELAARAFKVQHDDQRGVLTFLRLYSGCLEKGQKIYNLARDKSEQTGSLYVALADEYQPVERVTAGNIAVVGALKVTMTGDLVTSTQTSAKRAKTQLASWLKDPKKLEELMLPSARQRLQALEADPGPEETAELLLGIGATIPEPVFLCSIEPPSAAFQTALETALAELQREDPSLRVSTDEETGQLVLAGMGELHLEVLKERIVREYKIDAELGPLQIAYKETLVGEARLPYNVERRIGGARQAVRIDMSAKPAVLKSRDEVLRLDKTAESAANLAHVSPRLMQTVSRAVTSALRRGPKLACPLVDVQVTLHWLEVGRGTSDSVVASTIVHCLRKVFAEATSAVLEPMMALEVAVPESHSARVLADLMRRRAEVRQVHLRRDAKVVECIAPLSELLGYSSSLRSLSSGLATFSMEFHSHRRMSPLEEAKAVKDVTGF